MSKRNSFLVGKAFRAYLMATVLTVAATQIASLVDATLVGQLISAEALGAVNISKPVLQLTFSIGNLFIIGGSILTGMAIGTGDREQANRLFTKCLIAVVVAGLLILSCGLIWFDEILGMLCNSDNLREMAGQYLQVTFITMLPFLLSYMLETYVIVDGSPKLATIAVVISNIANVVLDITFISVFHWGVRGAATATLIMYVLSALILLWHFVRKKEGQKVLALDLGQEKGALGRMSMMGLPVTLTTFLIAVQIACCNIVAIEHLGDVGVVTFAVCIALLSFSMIFVSGTMRTIQPVGAILKGIGDSKGVLLMMWQSYKFLLLSLAIYSAVILIFPDEVCALFGVKDDFMSSIVADALPAFAMYIILEGLYSLLIPAYQFYDHNNLALFVALSKALFPMLGFWLMAIYCPEFAWWGFFMGMLLVIFILMPVTFHMQQKNVFLSPILLVPLPSKAEVFDLSIPADLSHINDATDGLMEFLKDKELSTRAMNYSALCMEELIKNIAEHSGAHFIDIRVIVCNATRIDIQKKVSISLHDDGKAFNPVEETNVAHPEEVEDKIGLALVHSISSDIRYEYLFNQNMVTIEVEDLKMHYYP